MPQLSGPTGCYRVVQIHPLLRCNLRCLHCYSSSGPENARSLPSEPLLAALDLLAREGFNGVGLSGGEPLLYSELFALLQRARERGMITTVTSNAMLITKERAGLLREHADVVAVSLDGPPEAHNRMRNHPRAFELMALGVDHLREAGVRFGFIFTLTYHNLHELSWIAEYAAEKGAALLQVHPLEEVGRGAAQTGGLSPDGLELGRSFVEVARLQNKYRDRLVIQYDVADIDILRAQPERGFAVQMDAPVPNEEGMLPPLADLIAPIVIEADGAIVPLQYNFSRRFELGNILSPTLESDLNTWKTQSFPEFLAVCRRAHKKLVDSDATTLPFVNWYGAVLNESRVSGDALTPVAV